MEVKTVQRILGCMSPVGTRAVQNQMLCDPHRLLVQVQGQAQDGGDGRLSALLSHLAPLLCLALVHCEGYTDSIPALRLLI